MLRPTGRATRATTRIVAADPLSTNATGVALVIVSSPGRGERTAAAANGYFVAAPNRVGREDNEYGDLAVDFYGSSQVLDPRGNLVGALGSATDEEVVIRDLDLDLIRQVRNDWQFYRDRRPESYTAITAP